MIDQLRQYFQDVINKEVDALVKRINVIRIGKIQSINASDFQVRLIEKSVYQNKIQSMPNLTCKILKNNGLIESYKVNDYVIIGFSDINYGQFHEGIGSFEIDYNSSVALMHSKSNAYILGRIEQQAINSIMTGLKEEDCQIVIQRESKKISIKNSNKKLDDVIKSQNEKINQLFTLCSAQNKLVINAFQAVVSLATAIKTLTINQTPFDNGANQLDSSIQQLQANIILETANDLTIETKNLELLNKTLQDIQKLFI